MCDYSLAGIPNRLAVEGEELLVHRFPTHSIGLASRADLLPPTIRTPGEQNIWQRIRNFFAPAIDQPNAVAVCIPPGARLQLRNIPSDLQRRLNIGEEESVTFMQTSAETTYRDAVCFSNGRQVLLQRLTEGIPAKVVSLSSASSPSEHWFVERTAAISGDRGVLYR